MVKSFVAYYWIWNCNNCYPDDWNYNTKVGVYDNDHPDLGISGGKAALVAFGPGFGDASRGEVLYEAGHNLSAGTEAENVAYQRVFLNFSFLAASQKVPSVLDLQIPNVMQSGLTYNVSVLASSPVGSGMTYRWIAKAGGTFGDTTAASTTFTPDTISGQMDGLVTCVVSDGCGRVGFSTSYQISQVVPPHAPPVAVDDTNYTDYENPVTLSVVDNDTDPNLDEINLSSLLGTAVIPGVGTFIDNGNNTVTFTPVQYYVGSATIEYILCDTTARCDTAEIIIYIAYPDTDGDGVLDNIDIDDDNDGILDVDESRSYDPLADADNDGTYNYLDLSPGSGLPIWVDSNSDGINDKYDADLDGVINAYDLDSDNDGIPDIIEAGGVDTDGDGIIDSSADSDSDGLIDAYDANNSGDAIMNLDTDGDGVKNYLDLDSDNDGIPDVLEASGTDANNDGQIDNYTDTDGDGFSDNVDGDVGNDRSSENIANALIITDADANSDGIPENYLRANNDENGLPNPYDLDADGDGILDVREAGIIIDTDNNGIADGTLGADGWSDDVDFIGNLTLTNSDSHGNPNYLDIDADNDGIVDNIEGQSTVGYTGLSGMDSDNDGIDNAYDNKDDSFGGNTLNGIVPENTDNTDDPDYADSDADNDGLLDRLEGWDSNGDGVINEEEIAFVGTTDSDGDGLFNEYDNNDAVMDPTNGTNPGNYPDVVNMGEDRDWREGTSTLPVELYSQSVKLIESDAVVVWTTATETNNEYFVVGRSQNDADYYELGTVNGAGNSNVLLNYSLIDTEPLEGVSYYRITQFDFDGKKETFPIMVLNVESKASQLKVYPNPTKDYVSIESAINGELSIINATGVLIYKADIISSQILRLETNKMESGIYLIKIGYADKVEMQKLIIK